MRMNEKERKRLRRHRRLRKRVFGTLERPRLAVHRSHLHLMVQLVDDTEGRVLAACTTRDPDFRKASPKGGNLPAAKLLGERVAQKALKAGIRKMVFDRGGFPYHGRIKAVAEAVRSQGVEV